MYSSPKTKSTVQVKGVGRDGKSKGIYRHRLIDISSSVHRYVQYIGIFDILEEIYRKIIQTDRVEQSIYII